MSHLLQRGEKYRFCIKTIASCTLIERFSERETKTKTLSSEYKIQTNRYSIKRTADRHN